MYTAHYYLLGILAVIVVMSLFSLSDAIKALANNKRKKGSN